MRRDEILEILAKHRDELSLRGVSSLRLFGSVARDEASPESDVDLLVAFDTPVSYSAFMKLRILLEDLLGARVDLVTESGLKDRERLQVEAEAIRVA
jgi:predicted nucleotidyltransferase